MAATITVTEHVGAGARAHRDRRSSRRPGPVSPRVYARRRALVGAISAAFVALTIVGSYDLLAGSSGAPASAAASRPAGAGSVVARTGDTLWSIAEEHRGDVAVRRYVDALIDLNGGPSIQAGQRVQLP